MRKVVMITGASRGVGRAAAIRFGEAGYTVVITASKSKEELEQTKQMLKEKKISVFSFLADAGDYEQMKGVIEEVKKQCGEIDVLVNNAGISWVGLFQDMNPSDYEKIVKNNLLSVFHCSHLVIPQMVAKKKGKIINVSSVWGNVGASCEVVYSAAKGGINSFTKALGKELAPSNIQVNAVALGVVDTQMNDCFTEEEKMELADSIPAGRFAKPEEAAELLFQIAENHEYLNGQVITLDGGWC